MKKTNVLVLCFLLPLSVFAQQRPQFSQYMINNFLFNPAFAGSQPYTDLRLGFRNQWTGFDDAPRTLFLSGHTNLENLKKDAARGALPTIGTEDYGKGNPLNRGQNGVSDLRHGFGAAFIYDDTGPISRLMAHLTYALHVSLSEKLHLSLGTQIGLLQYRLDNDQLDPLQPDPNIGAGLATDVVPDLGLGILLYRDNFYFGISVNQLLRNSVGITEGDALNELVVHYNINAGYEIKIGSIVYLQPSTLIKFLEASPVSWDLNCRFRFEFPKNTLWLGASYRHDDAIVGLAGFQVTPQFDVHYSYDLTTTGVSDFNSGTHEISLGLKIGRNRNNRNTVFE